MLQRSGFNLLMKLSVILILARKHLGKGDMESSARSCRAEAIRFEEDGDYPSAARRALRSLAYSGGICHEDYKKAFHHSGIEGECRLMN